MAGGPGAQGYLSIYSSPEDPLETGIPSNTLSEAPEWQLCCLQARVLLSFKGTCTAKDLGTG